MQGYEIEEENTMKQKSEYAHFGRRGGGGGAVDKMEPARQLSC